MAIKQVKKETGTEPTSAPRTFKLELAHASTYIHPSGMVFSKGGIYTLGEKDARALLGKLDDMGSPYFRLFIKPEDRPQPVDPLAAITGDTVTTLPDSLQNWLEPKTAESAPVVPEPAVLDVFLPEFDAQGDTASVDSGEIDTASGVEV